MRCSLCAEFSTSAKISHKALGVAWLAEIYARLRRWETYVKRVRLLIST